MRNYWRAMNIPMTPPQVAKQLGVATITVYKWIEAKKLPATSIKTGHSTRIYIDAADVEMKRIELESRNDRLDGANPPMAEPANEWVRQYQDLIGKIPPLYVPFRQGKVTFEQMKAEAVRRFEILSL